MFACMAKSEEKSELMRDEFPEVQAREEDESREWTQWTLKNFHPRSALLNLQNLLYREIFFYNKKKINYTLTKEKEMIGFLMGFSISSGVF